jgi:ABC-2 type transport system permease protein
VSTFLPPVAPLVMPTRIAGGDAALWEIAASLVIMLISIVAVVLLAARLYEGAILRTGARVKLGDAWRGARRQAAAGRA